MVAVGAFAAKAQFSALLERVARGEEVIISKHGRPVAKLVPARTHDRERVAEAIRRLKQCARAPPSAEYPGVSCGTRAVGEWHGPRLLDRRHLVLRERGRGGH